VDAAEFLPLVQGGLAGHALVEPVAQCQPGDTPQADSALVLLSQADQTEAAAAAAAAAAAPHANAALNAAAPAPQPAPPGDLSKLLTDQVR
jgi:hypothetical protein